jgi:hypothetical protein
MDHEIIKSDFIIVNVLNLFGFFGFQIEIRVVSDVQKNTVASDHRLDALRLEWIERVKTGLSPD